MRDTTGWHEFAHVVKSTTHIAYIYENGSAYFPEGPTVVGPDDFTYAAARGKVHRLVRADEYEGWRPPARVITDPAAADLLPIGTVVVNDGGQVAQLYDGPGAWWQVLDNDPLDSSALIGTGSITVLHTPAEEA